jgi:thrombospondin type 3 repeat protein
MRWQMLLLTAMSITVALSLGGCRPQSGVEQGIKHGAMMPGAIELRKAIKLHEAIELPRGVPPGMGREIVLPGEATTATKIKDKTKELGDELLEQALDNGPEAFDQYQDIDSDLDGRFNLLDNCPDVFNGYQKDSDSDGYGDVCDFDMYAYIDVDADGDSVEDSTDNCPTVWNLSQENFNSFFDEEGDACDPDMDGDGVDNVGELEFDPDMDGDEERYTIDPDNDGDGVVNAYDRFDWHPAYY